MAISTLKAATKGDGEAAAYAQVELFVVYGLFALLLLLSVSVCAWCAYRRKGAAKETHTDAEDAIELHRVASTSMHGTTRSPAPGTSKLYTAGSTEQAPPKCPGAVELNPSQLPDVPDDAEDDVLCPGSAKHSVEEDGADTFYDKGSRTTRKE